MSTILNGTGTGTKPVIGVILASTRQGRIGERVARWIHRIASERADLEFELIDLLDWPLPFFAHPVPTMMMERNYADERERAWVRLIERLDGFIVVTPEYNHGYPAALKNALDYAYAGWNRKPVAFVSYGGSAGGVRAVQQLRQVVVELQMAPIRAEVNIPFAMKGFNERGEPTDPLHIKRASAMLDDLAWWTRALREGCKKITG